jgi:8-oxo-dGTP diphosphatase
MPIKFCTQCGQPVEEQHKYGRLRPVCMGCGHIHFIDPKVAAATIIVEDGKVLLTRRAGDPQKGLWVPPGGFMDYDEDPQQAAIRECREETGLEVEIDSVMDIVASAALGGTIVGGATFVIFYRAHIVGGTLAPSDDADLAGWFGPNDLPELAFEQTRVVLNKWREEML